MENALKVVPLFTARLHNVSLESGGLLCLNNYFRRVTWTEIFARSFVYCLNRNTYAYVLSFLRRNVEGTTPYSKLYGFNWVRFVLFSGLGYKRRFSKKYRIMFTYTGDRHWILYKFQPQSFVVPVRRRNFIFFSNTKGKFVRDYSFFASLRSPQVYKMKGFMDARVRGRFLFVRRIRIRGVQTKLSKKQQLL